jgi:hypothetical protein
MQQQAPRCTSSPANNPRPQPVRTPPRRLSEHHALYLCAPPHPATCAAYDGDRANRTGTARAQPHSCSTPAHGCSKHPAGCMVQPAATPCAKRHARPCHRVTPSPSAATSTATGPAQQQGWRPLAVAPRPPLGPLGTGCWRRRQARCGWWVCRLACGGASQTGALRRCAWPRLLAASAGGHAPTHTHRQA